ncbi:hypothetical protein PEC301619_04830 [Pectobacterium carotovorum subsp. carotovorum]|nr:hypothetical protein PEC301619_04830 [Pectobacterium carotovorum subsp. carotovorum]
MTGINNSLDALATIGTNAKLKLRNGIEQRLEVQEISNLL